MSKLEETLKNDPEINELKEKYFKYFGTWCLYHWDCFPTMEDYIRYMKDKIKEYEDKHAV